MLELADAVIVGGGIVGTALAAALGRRLSRVALLEAERCGGSATGGGFAWVNASSKWQNETYHRLNAEACRLYLKIAAEWGGERIGWHGGGSLFWVDPAEAHTEGRLRLQAEALAGWGHPTSLLTRGEMQALEPYLPFTENALGLFAPSEGWVEIPRLIRFFLEQARGHSVEINEFTLVTGFTLDHTGGIATVETTRGRISTRLLILAAGVQTGALAAQVIGLDPGRAPIQIQQVPGLLLETDPLPEPLPVHRVCYPPDKAGLHLRPAPDGGLLLGADDTDALCTPPQTAARTGADGEGPARKPADFFEAHRILRERAAPLIPGLEKADSARLRLCVRPVPPDGLPVAGPLTMTRGVYLLTTHSGVTLGPLLAHLLAEEIVTGRRSPLLDPYRPSRFSSQFSSQFSPQPETRG